MTLPSASGRRARLAGTITLLALLAGACSQEGGETPAPAVDSSTPGLDVALRDYSGKRLELSSLRGKVVVVDIWATWCPPCRMEIPELVELSRRKPSDVAFVGILTGDDPSRLPGFLQAQPIPYPIAIGDDRTQEVFPTTALPTLFILDRKGRLRTSLVGLRQSDEIWSHVQEYL